MDDSLTSKELAEQIASGHRKAEGILYQRFSKAVFFMLRQRCGDKMLAEDLLHETFRIVIERLRGDGLENPERLGAFIHKVGTNLAIGEARKQSRRNTHYDSDSIFQISDSAPDALDLLSRQDAANYVHMVLDELKVRRDRDLLYDYFIEELDKETLCKRYELSTDHFDRVLYRAKQRFRRLIEEKNQKE